MNKYFPINDSWGVGLLYLLCNLWWLKGGFTLFISEYLIQWMNPPLQVHFAINNCAIYGG